MSPRTRAGIRGAIRMVVLLWQDNPANAIRFAGDLRNELTPSSSNFHARRLAADAAADAVDALLTAQHLTAGAR